MPRSRTRHHVVYKTPEIIHESPIYVNQIADTLEYKTQPRVQHPTRGYRDDPFTNMNMLQHISDFLSAEDLMQLRKVAKKPRQVKVIPQHIVITESNIRELLPLLREEKTPHSFSTDTDIIPLLIEQGVSVAVLRSILQHGASAYYILHAAGVEGRVDVVQMLIDENLIDIFADDFDFNGGWDINVIKYIIERGVEPREFLLETAIDGENYEAVKYLAEIIPLDAYLIQDVQTSQMLRLLISLGMPIDFEEVEILIHTRFNSGFPVHMDIIDVIVEHEPYFPFEYYMDMVQP